MGGLLADRSDRRGSAVILVVGLLILLSLLLHRLSSRSRGQAVQTRALAIDSEHQSLAEGVLNGVLARLKQRPWEVRYYSRGGVGSGAYGSRHEGEYRGSQYKLWVQDVQLGSTEAVPGLVDLFVELLHQDLTRRFHLRASLLPRSVRSDQRLEVVYFARTPELLELEEGRQRAGQAATDILLEAEDQRIESQSVLEQVAVEDSSTAHPRDLAGQSLGEDTSERAQELKDAERDLAKGIHLMAEDGAGLQRLLPPLQRSRFLRRTPDHGAAQSLLRQVADSARATVLQTLLARIALARSLFAQAWKDGPASTRGRQLLERAWAALQAAREVLDAVDPAIRKELSPTLRASIFVEMARVAVAAGWTDRENQALVDAQTEVGDQPLYGGREELDDVLAATLSPLRSPEAQERLGSEEPLQDSGFAPVTLGEVDGFLDQTHQGWDAWPTDSGLPQTFWDDLWQDQMVTDGEGGSGEDSGNIDRNGDGLEDEDMILDETEEDGGIVEDVLVPPHEKGLHDAATASVWNCEANHSDNAAASECIEGVLEDFVSAGGTNLHIHNQIGRGGKGVHAKVKDGKVKTAKSGVKVKSNSKWEHSKGGKSGGSKSGGSKSGSSGSSSGKSSGLGKTISKSLSKSPTSTKVHTKSHDSKKLEGVHEVLGKHSK